MSQLPSPQHEMTSFWRSVQLYESLPLHLRDIKMNVGVCTSLLNVSFRGREYVLLHSWSPVDDAKKGNLRKTKERLIKPANLTWGCLKEKITLKRVRKPVQCNTIQCNILLFVMLYWIAFYSVSYTIQSNTKTNCNNTQGNSSPVCLRSSTWFQIYFRATILHYILHVVLMCQCISC